MIVCIPTQENQGLESSAFAHFGSAPAFIIHDTETGVTRFRENNNQDHAHGSCNPGRTLMGESVDAVITGGMGARAVEMLNAMGIRVYMAAAGTVQSNVEALKKQELVELTMSNACGNHGMHGGCGH